MSNIFAREALAVDVGMRFYGFSIEKHAIIKAVEFVLPSYALGLQWHLLLLLHPHLLNHNHHCRIHRYIA